MRLNDPLITEFTFKGETYSIDLSFDNVLDVFDVLYDEVLNPLEKAETALNLLIGCVPDSDVIDMWNLIYQEFIKIENETSIEYDLQGNPMPVQQEHEQLIDLSIDAEFIYASFQQAYGVNLYKEQGKLHWHEFQSLLNGLPDETIMKRIIQIRAWKPKNTDSPDYKADMEKLQRKYSLAQEEVE
ncbi:Gp15 family bacteriophage protein [Cytobacillus sp. OWB-43]|uniref:Gp15 family bacteriophage protein n=1 Tax=Cytobacillus sp. OWB-43 TaxID=3108468 RepID=UPI002AFED97F|nr:Gp15 family bacteriophage protein [Cytobacillus sp. OWB-43]MEA1855585.1 Gp15 family bacteriophage protein [Cytobacillus sp. OWB-43]